MEANYFKVYDSKSGYPSIPCSEISSPRNSSSRDTRIPIVAFIITHKIQLIRKVKTPTATTPTS